jgi:hypothetical protein
MNTTAERDGSTPELAIAEDQWAWRRRNCPDARLVLQKLIRERNKFFDELTLRSGDELRIVYFDVSVHFEKAHRLSRRRLDRHSSRHRRRCAYVLNRIRT